MLKGEAKNIAQVKWEALHCGVLVLCVQQLLTEEKRQKEVRLRYTDVS